MKSKPQRSSCILLLGLLAIQVGCAATGHHQAVPLPPVVPESIPRELSKVTLPDYVIEPPDVLTIGAINVYPLPPYRLSTFDSISLEVEGAPVDRPISGLFTIEPGGLVRLGYNYGMVKVGGLTIDEARDRIRDHLQGTLRSPQVWIGLSQLASQQDIQGEHLVQPDGTVNLGTYGRVRVVGMTIEQARAAIEAHLSNQLENPKISLDVYGFNSKYYYVITQGAGLGDQVYRIPSMGNETVMDAISQINGLTSLSSSRMWIARPGSNACGGDQILPVDWYGVSQRADPSTNYQVLPNDRLYIAQNRLVAFDNALAKLLAPFERVLGFTALGTSVVHELRFFHVARGRGFF